VHHVIEALSAKELAAALDGYRFFGLDAAAAALEDARARPIEEIVDDDDAARREDEVNQFYWAALPDDVLDRAFEERYRADPGAFEPFVGVWGTGT